MRDVPIRSALLMLCLLSFFGLQYSVFLPIYAQRHSAWRRKKLGPADERCGSRRGARGVAICCSHATIRGLSRWIASTCTVCAVCLILMSHAAAFWLCALLLFAVGFAATSQMAATNTIIQERVPDEMRSRLMAVYATMFMGVQPLGALLAGGVAKRIGTPDTVLLFGLVVLAGCLVFIWWVVTRAARTPVGASVSG